MQRLNQSKFNKNRIWRKNSEKWSAKTREIIWCKASLSSLIRLPIVHRDRRVQFEFLRRPQRPTSLCSLRRPLFSHSLDLGPTPLKPGMIGAQRSDLLLGLFRPAKHSIQFDDIFFSSLNLVPRNYFSDSSGFPRTFFVLVTGENVKSWFFFSLNLFLVMI